MISRVMSGCCTSRAIMLRLQSRSVIYLTAVSPRSRLSPPSGGSSSLPPGKGEQPLNAGILGFATHKACGMPCRHSIRWALTPPFHPYSHPFPHNRVIVEAVGGSGRFLSRYSAVADSFPLESMALYVARTFLTPLLVGMSDGMSGCFSAKIVIIPKLRNKKRQTDSNDEGQKSST